MNFNLSLSGKISAALIMAFVLTGQSSAAGIVAGGDAAKQAQINTANNGAVVVNIVAPGAAGLSHNQFKDFNVGLPGAVLNNSTIAGQSQLAGQLNANTQLGHQAAKVILNEVVSRNPSLLLGKQEIFGMAADYVLANPNGITCDGCGFINTPRASLLVGTARIENGSIQSLDAAQNRNLLLVNTGGAQGEKVLDLIAPRIEIRGSVRADQAINAIAGFNNVAQNLATGGTTLLSTRPAAEGSSSLDSYYLGAIQAGRVNLVSTAAGAGVNITGPVTG
ncbi:MAG: filamentous hemagglutinin N-terminal domain-containing protein, partial [Iodobacter sp.]